jgi:hypothetical protein
MHSVAASNAVVLLRVRRGEDGRLRPPAAGGAGGERSEPPLIS